MPEGDFVWEDKCPGKRHQRSCKTTSCAVASRRKSQACSHCTLETCVLRPLCNLASAQLFLRLASDGDRLPIPPRRRKGPCLRRRNGHDAVWQGLLPERLL